jgi:two-component system KDP operon response regulator KdpE
MASLKKLLIIEDEPAILTFLRSSLHDRWEVTEARTGRLGLELAARGKPDVILLDLGLPDQDGLEVLKALRKWTSVPVIIVSARGQDFDKIKGLDAGADDYLIKPFSVPELRARLRVALRHAAATPEDAPPLYENHGLKVDLVAHRVWLNKKEIHLSPRQYEILALLVRHAGRVVRQTQLVKEVWGTDREVTPELVRITVHQLRHKIEPEPVRPRCLKTEPGIGYRLEAPEE